ncbi:MAG: lytic murein transglycosylase B [Rubrivivax sp.]|nr:lytic murein transglycosylase B [Rubrivivax sp.]
MRVSSIVPGLSAAALLLQLLAAPAQAERPAARPGKAKAVRAEAGHSYRHRAELRAFAAEVATRHDWDASWVQAQLADARRLPRVAQLIMPPAVGAAKNWAAYHDRFVEPRRIQAGLDFWQTHQDTLQRAEDRFGVPAAVVVGIIGVETFYGRITGNFRVVDALATLSFDFPAGRSDRSAFFFRNELEELLVLARREGVRADSIRGSYAGAIGWPQFLPGSINRHAVDFDGDGHIDLQRSVADAIGSVAHLQRHGWQPGMATHFEVQPPPLGAPARATLLAPDILPSFDATRFAELGATLDDAGRRHDGPLALVELHNGQAAPSHVAGTQNFYVLTRYNWSSYYAMAVITLGEAVKAARTKAGASAGGS